MAPRNASRHSSAARAARAARAGECWREGNLHSLQRVDPAQESSHPARDAAAQASGTGPGPQQPATLRSIRRNGSSRCRCSCRRPQPRTRFLPGVECQGEVVRAHIAVLGPGDGEGPLQGRGRQGGRAGRKRGYKIAMRAQPQAPAQREPSAAFNASAQTRRKKSYSLLCTASPACSACKLQSGWSGSAAC